MKDGRIKVVPSEDGQTPDGKMYLSAIAFKENGEVIVGKAAVDYSYSNPERVVRWVKREIGSDYRFRIDGTTYTPQEISSFLLKKIKIDSEKFVGEPINRAVITVPAYFNNTQRNATKQAGELAGFQVLRILSEPTAAAMAYGLDRLGSDLNIAVVDLGAGTFDITILELRNGLLRVRSTSGDTLLGGKDMDDEILSYLKVEIARNNNLDLEKDPLDSVSLNILRSVAEESKIRLSRSRRITISPELLYMGKTLKPSLALTRGKLEQLIGDLTSRLEEPIRRALEDSGLEPSEIDRLLLVGGPTKMPIVRKRISKIFGKEPEEGIDPMNVVATGAAIQASVLSGEINDILLMDVLPLSLGVETTGGVFTRMILRNTTIPTSASRKFATESNGQTSMIIHVLQGEREVARGNTSLGLLQIDGIPRAPRFEEEVEVTFTIDADGILEVSAEVLSTGNRFKVPVRNVRELSESEIASRIIEATKFNDEDSMHLENIKVRENSEAILIGANRSFDDAEGYLSEEERGRFLRAEDRLNDSLMRNDLNRITRDTDVLRELVEALVSKTNVVRRLNLLSSSISSEPQSDQNEALVLIRESLKKVRSVSVGDAEAEVKSLSEALLLRELDESDSK